MSEGLNHKDQIDRYKLHLDHCKFIGDKIKFNQETADRQFSFYLLFITTPIVLLAALVTKVEKVIDVNVWPVCLLLFFIGLCFSWGFNKARIIRLGLILELIVAERNYLEPFLYGRTLNELTNLNTVKKNFFDRNGSDFFVSLVQMFTNCFWFTASVHFGLGYDDYRLVIVFILMLSIQYLFRNKLLRKYEALRPGASSPQ